MVEPAYVLLGLCFCLGTASAHQVYVSTDGVSNSDCGASLESACSNFSHVLSKAQEGDTIFISSSRGSLSEFFCRPSPLEITKSLVIEGVNNNVYVGCPIGSTQALLFRLRLSKRRSLPKVVFKNITFNNVVFTVTEGIVMLINCRLIESKMEAGGRCDSAEFRILNSEWIGSVKKNCTAECEPTGLLRARCRSIVLRIENSVLRHTNVHVWGVQSVDVTVTDSLVSSRPDTQLGHGGIVIRLSNSTNYSQVLVRHSIFEDQVNFSPIDAVMNLHEAALRITMYPPFADIGQSRVQVHIEDCKFVNNERAVTIIGSFEAVSVTNCFFQNNIAMHSAGAILVNTIATSPYFYNCTFEGNAAGSYRQELLKPYKKIFRVSGDEAWVSSKRWNGVISLVGKGGAIRAFRGNITIDDCIFKNNFARLQGGAVFVDRDGIASIESTAISNSPTREHAMQGELIYSDGMLYIKSARLEVLSAKNHLAILHHTGHRWSVDVQQVSITCPPGYSLRIQNASSTNVQPGAGLRSSYKMDQLFYFCDPCPRNKYSLDYGSLNYTLTQSSQAYFTFFLNGSIPNLLKNSTYGFQDINCLHCPYGGTCDEKITAVANFWGFVEDHEVKFQHCPKGYCCSLANCSGFNRCAENRVGRLCARCKPGYSEALFSAECVPDEECDATYLWPFALASAFTYVLLLLFQEDVLDFMSSRLRGPKKAVTTLQTKQPKIREVKLETFRESTPTRMGVSEQRHLSVDGSIPNRNRSERYSNDYLWQNGYGFKHGGHDELRQTNSVKDKTFPEVAEREKTSYAFELESEASEGEDDPTQSGGQRLYPDTGAIFLIILCYYMQDAQLLQIPTILGSGDSSVQGFWRELLAGLFSFQLDISLFIGGLCFIPGLEPAVKLLAMMLIIPCMLLIFGVFFCFYKFCNELRKLCLDGQAHDTESQHTPMDVTYKRKTFSTRMATGFVLALLFTYQKLATTSCTLLNCVPIHSESVLFIDGTITCYDTWQYGVIAFAAFWVVPFWMLMFWGPGLLSQGYISLLHFFLSFAFPPPFLIYWFYIRFKIRRSEITPDNKLTIESLAIIRILQGPFKENKTKILGHTCWVGVLIARRLILVLLYTFVNDNLIRLSCMTMVCLLLLLHHAQVMPYRQTLENVAESVSAGALLIVGGINLVRAAFEAAEYVPHGPNATLLRVYEKVESALLVWIPAVVMCVVLLILAVKLLVILLTAILKLRVGSTSYTDSGRRETS